MNEVRPVEVIYLDFNQGFQHCLLHYSYIPVRTLQSGWMNKNLKKSNWIKKNPKPDRTQRVIIMGFSLPGGQWQVEGFILGHVLFNDFIYDLEVVNGVRSHQVFSWHQIAGSVDTLEGRMAIQRRQDEGVGNRNLSNVPQREWMWSPVLGREGPPAMIQAGTWPSEEQLCWKYPGSAGGCKVGTSPGSKASWEHPRLF